jgi:hypothetical protein
MVASFQMAASSPSRGAGERRQRITKGRLLAPELVKNDPARIEYHLTRFDLLTSRSP